MAHHAICEQELHPINATSEGRNTHKVRSLFWVWPSVGSDVKPRMRNEFAHHVSSNRWIWSVHGMLIGKGRPTHFQKNLPQWHFAHHKPHINWFGTGPSG